MSSCADMARKDRYNKKILKYYVTYNEDDSDMDEQIDTEKHEEQETGKQKLDLSGPTSSGLEKAPTVSDSDQESSADEKEKKAIEVTHGQQELINFKKFSDSLLSKSARLHNLLAELEEYIPDMPDGADKKKAQKSAKGLEEVIGVLEDENEKMETCRAQCAKLSNTQLSEEDLKRLVSQLDGQMQKTTVACLVSTAFQEPAEEAEGWQLSTATVLELIRASPRNMSPSMQMPPPTCGKILLRCKNHASAFREHMGVQLCVFKIGVTANVPRRYADYVKKNFTAMWILHSGDEAAVIQQTVVVKAPCKHVVEIAIAAVADDPEGGHTPALRELTSVSLTDAETGVHRVFRKYGLAADLPLKRAVIGPGPLAAFPYLNFSDWVKYLVERRQLGQLCGTNDIQQMNVLLSEFWRRYKLVEPDHELWAFAAANEVDLKFCLPIYSHTDEGRTLKKKPIWILSCHGALGAGTSKNIRNVPVSPTNIMEDGMRLNFLGNTWGTQFLVSVMTRHLQTQHPDSMQKVVAHFAKDMHMLLKQGVTSKDGSLKIWCIHIANKGDLPALIRMGNFERNYARCPKAPSSKKQCLGICHYCQAGVEGPGNTPLHPWEDFRESASWRSTLFQEVPWEIEPQVLMGLPTARGAQESFFVVDVWHTFQYGIARYYLGSAMIHFITHFFHDSSWDAKFAHLSTEYFAFCRTRRLTPHLQEINEYTFNYESEKAFPLGHWAKGAVSTNMMLFLEDLLQRYVVDQTDDEIFLALVPGSKGQHGFY
ncbi:unnamed protein product [Symbiodinium sp. CCMP2456]|nr:unnamed protein product [Symbiodinium sp. CCMP2456]